MVPPSLVFRIPTDRVVDQPPDSSLPIRSNQAVFNWSLDSCDEVFIDVLYFEFSISFGIRDQLIIAVVLEYSESFVFISAFQVFVYVWLLYFVVAFINPVKSQISLISILFSEIGQVVGTLFFNPY